MRQTTLGMTLAALCAAAACGEEEQAVEPRSSRPVQVPSSTSEYTLESYVCMKPWEVADVPRKGEFYASLPNQRQLFCNGALIKSSDHSYSVPCDTEFTACIADPQWILGLEGKSWATHGVTYNEEGFEYSCGPGPSTCFGGGDSEDSSWAHREPGEVPSEVLSFEGQLVPVWCPAITSLSYGGFVTDGLTVWTDNMRTTPEARLDLFVDCYVPQ